MAAAVSARLPPPWAVATGLFVALVVPYLTFEGFSAFLGAAQSPSRIELGIAAHWANVALLVAVVLLAERMPLASIGVRPFRWWTIPLGLVAGAIITVIAGVLANFFRLSADAHMAAFLQSQSLPLRAALVVTAGVFEETLYRGYAIERLTALTGSKWLAAVLTLAVFTLMHGPAVGWDHLGPVAAAGLLVTLLYLWRRDLVLNAVAHATVDGIGLILVPLLAH